MGAPSSFVYRRGRGLSYVLLGGNGLLGSGFQSLLRLQGTTATRVQPRWLIKGAARDDVRRSLHDLCASGQPATILWAAGVGQIGAGASAFRAETEALAGLVSAVSQMSDEQARGTSVVFASSAGALYGGHLGEVEEHTQPAPATAYGVEKLRQEALLRELSGNCGCRVIAARISNIYGLANGTLTARGLIATAVRSTRLRTPMTVFVSPDNRRDYVYNQDAAADMLTLASRLTEGEFSTALIRSGTTRTVAEILSTVGRVAGRRVPATFAERAETRLQPRALRFTPRTHGSSPVRQLPLEAGIHRMLRAPMVG